jgi:hypothetical protein
MNKLLVSHVWNDELYLRGWLRHHARIFDHGVLILTQSHDKTASIIKDEVPSWAVVHPYTSKLTTGVLERQIEDIEKGYPKWWKMCLTVTEYLLTPNLDKALGSAPSDALYVSGGYGLVDGEDEISLPYDPAIPVFQQRHFGFDMMRVPVRGRNNGRRLIHSRIHGAYQIGRHWTNHQDVPDWSSVRLVRAFYSPYNEMGIKRKLNMGRNISDKDKLEGRCWQHFMTREQIHQDYLDLRNQSGHIDDAMLWGGLG